MIGITMGDSSGIGPELILAAHSRGLLTRADGAHRSAGADAPDAPPYVVIGDLEVLEHCNHRLGYGVALERYAGGRSPGGNEAHGGTRGRAGGGSTRAPEGVPPLPVIDLGIIGKEDIRIGEISAASGAAAKRYVEEATRLALDGVISAVVTLPMNKEATRLSDPSFTGHTEIIAGICGVEDYTMMLASEKLIVTHVSTHVSLTDAIAQVKRDRILSVIRLTWAAVERFFADPVIAVAGLNPHAGEGGAFGRQELEEIRPAVEAGIREGIDVVGPESPDTVFMRAAKGLFQAVVCMYHDQGHIPMKLLDFEGGVNVTLGLPIVRTSVDHGTAFDIAWKGLASPVSLVAAYRFACRLLGHGT